MQQHPRPRELDPKLRVASLLITTRTFKSTSSPLHEEYPFEFIFCKGDAVAKHSLPQPLKSSVFAVLMAQIYVSRQETLCHPRILHSRRADAVCIEPLRHDIKSQSPHLFLFALHMCRYRGVLMTTSRRYEEDVVRR